MIYVYSAWLTQMNRTRKAINNKTYLNKDWKGFQAPYTINYPKAILLTTFNLRIQQKAHL